MTPRYTNQRVHRALISMFAAAWLLAGAGYVEVEARETIFFSLERDTPSLSAPCQARLKGTSAEYKYWEQQLGHQIFFHYHHYCFGVFEMQKAMTAPGLDRASQMALYRDAITQFDYVLNRWPKNHPLYQESATYKEIALMRLGRKK